MSIDIGSGHVFASGSVHNPVTIKLTSTKFVIAWRDSDDNNKGKMCVGEVSGFIINYGPTVTFSSTPLFIPTYDQDIHVSHDLAGLSSTNFLICYLNHHNAHFFRGCTISGITITMGAETHEKVFPPPEYYDDKEHGIACCKIADNKVLVATNDHKNASYQCISERIITVNGTICLLGTKSEIYTTKEYNYDIAFIRYTRRESGYALLSWVVYGTLFNVGDLYVLTTYYNGSTLSHGSKISLYNDSTPILHPKSAESVLLNESDFIISSKIVYFKANNFLIKSSGTTTTNLNSNNFPDSYNMIHVGVGLRKNNSNFDVIFIDEGDNNYGKIIRGYVDNNNINYTNIENWQEASASESTGCTLDDNTIIVAYRNVNDNGYGTIRIIITNPPSFANSTDLFIAGQDITEVSDDLFIYGHKDIAQSHDLFLHGYSEASGQIPLYIHGLTSFSGDVPLYLEGYQNYSGSIDLFIQGYDIHQDNIDLFIGGYNNVSGNIPLFIEAAALEQLISGNFDLFIGGYDVVNNNVDLFIDGYAVASGDVTLYINGYLYNSGNIPLYIDGYDYQFGSIPLYIDGYYIISGNIPLYITGSNSSFSNIPLIIDGYFVDSNNIPLFIYGYNLHSGDIDLFISGNEFRDDNIDLFIYGKNTQNGSCTLSIHGYSDYNNDTTLFIDGHGFVSESTPLITIGSGIISYSGNIDLFINGYGPLEPIVCPTLDPTATIQVPSSIIDIYQNRVDTLLNKVGKNVWLQFDPNISQCPNCDFDPIRNRSSGRYKVGGPSPFIFGRKCPYCKGRGVLEEEVGLCIKCLISWNPSEISKFGISVQKDSEIVKIKTLIDNAANIKRARMAIIDRQVVDTVKYQAKLIKGPYPLGLREDRYCISFWRTI